MTAGQELARRLGAAAAEGRRVRPVGGGTKLAWGGDGASADVELSTAGLNRVSEHNAGDYVAVLEGGAPLAAVRERLAGAGQRLALDPPLGKDEAATIGGALATGDSGPLRHRYGGPRDLVVGMTVALSDGTLARAGGRVIKNVAGYDLAKLMTGSFGTLGVIVEAVMRLHPLPAATATAVARGADTRALAAAAGELAHQRLELESLDVGWAGGEGVVLARAGGALPRPAAERAAAALAAAGLDADVVDDDEQLWERQRSGQRARADDDVVVKVSAVQTQLPGVLAAARRLDAEVVGRAALGLSWVRIPRGGAEAVSELRAQLAPAACVVLDAPAAVRGAVDPWGEPDSATLELMRRVKARFDPVGALRPGAFVGGL